YPPRSTLFPYTTLFRSLVLVLGLVAVLAVFRRWAWDEEDRAAGLTRRRAPGNEDYNNELLVALSAVFMLGSLLVWRLTGLHFFRSEEHTSELQSRENLV